MLWPTYIRIELVSCSIKAKHEISMVYLLGMWYNLIKRIEWVGLVRRARWRLRVDDFGVVVSLYLNGIQSGSSVHSMAKVITYTLRRLRHLYY